MEPCWWRRKPSRLLTTVLGRNDFDRWFTGPHFSLRDEMECNSYDTSGKLSVVEKLVN